MSDVSQATVDQAGITRGPTGEIIEPIPKEDLPKTTESKLATTTPSDSPKTEEKDEGTLLEPKKEEPKAEAKGAPDKYSDFKVPDGYELIPEVAEGAGKLFKEMGLSQDQAQKLVDFYVAENQKTYNQPFEYFQTMKDGWREEAGRHPELFGKLAPDGPVRAALGRMLDGLGDAALTTSFKEAMNLTGVGDHPAFIRVMYKLAQMVTEGGHVAGRGPSEKGMENPNAPRSAAHAMYPNLP